MAKVQFLVNLFKVNHSDGTEKLSQLLKQIAADPIDKRVRSINGVNYRLETAEKRKDGSWRLDFVKFREGHGPGKVSAKKPLEGFELDADDYFGEDTAAIYRPKHKYMVLQYNHWGVRHSAIQQYLSSYVDVDPPNIYTLRPKLDLEVDRRLQHKTIIRRLEIGIAVNHMTAADRKADRSVADVSAIGEAFGADRVYISVSVSGRDPKRSLIGKIKQLAKTFTKDVSDDAQQRLVIFGKDTPEAEVEALDLLEQKLTFTAKIHLGSDRRLAFDDRCDALDRAATRWKHLMD